MTEVAGINLRPRHVLIGVVAAVLVGALVITTIGRAAGFADLGDAVSGADYRWLAVCVAGQVAVFAGYAGALRAAVASGHQTRVPLGVSVRLVLASFAATQLFAFAGAGGLAVIYWALRRVGMTREESAVRLIGLSTAVYLVFGVLGWAAALWSLAAASAPLGVTVPWLVLFPLVLVAARWFTSPGRIGRWTQPLSANTSPVGIRRRALATGVGAAAWVRTMVTAREGRPLFAWAALYWVGDIASLWAALHAFDAVPSLRLLALAYATGYLAQSLPIPFIATGGVDAATTFLLQLFGVPLEVALAAVITHRVFAFWLPVIPGSICALTVTRLGRQLNEANRSFI